MQGSRVTIIDVARVAGVSKSTVANVMRDAPGIPIHDVTRQRVLAAASHLGYRRNALAAALSSGRTHTIGIILPGHHLRATSRVYRTYGQDLFIALYEAAARAGLRVTPIPPVEDTPDVLSELADRRVDGLVLASLRNAALVRSILDSGIPSVEIGSGYGPNLVHPDNEGGARLAVEHLTELGHRRIVHFRGPSGGYFAADHRADGFREACRAQGLGEDETPVLAELEEVEARLRRPAGERSTAVFTFNDCQANEILDLAQDLGLRTPADLSVVGFDDGVVAELARPRLTTVNNALDAQADAAIARLQILMARSHSLLSQDTAEESETLRIPTHLIVRESTAPAPAE